MSTDPYSLSDPYGSSLYPCMQQDPLPPPPPYSAEAEKKMPLPTATAQPATAPPAATTAQPAKSTGEPMYILKTVQYQGRKTNVLCQSFNGPCPLLALVNVLVLQKKVVIRGTHISGSKLLEVVGNIVMRNPRLKESDLNTVLEMLPSLQSGLDVNVLFTKGIFGFDETDALKLFGLARVPLMHGWLVDPSDKELYAALEGKSFNSAQIAMHDTSVLPEHRLLIEAFLEGSQQLTVYGLAQLHSQMKAIEPVSDKTDERLGVLFYNNHFSTVCYRKGRLYRLVTDEGYADSSVMWELIQGINGETCFYRENFEPFGARTVPISTLQTPASATSKSTAPKKAREEQKQELSDEELARRLEAEEKKLIEQEAADFEMAKRLQGKESHHHSKLRRWLL